MMKKYVLALTTVLVLSFAGSAQADARVDVNGLVCDFCARALEKVFSKQEAVQDIDVNLDTKVITINFKEGQTLDDDVIKGLITDAGYNVVGIERDE